MSNSDELKATKEACVDILDLVFEGKDTGKDKLNTLNNLLNRSISQVLDKEGLNNSETQKKLDGLFKDCQVQVLGK